MKFISRIRIPDFLFRALVLATLVIVTVAFSGERLPLYDFLKDQGSALGAFATFLAVVVALWTADSARRQNERIQRRQLAANGLVLARVFEGILGNLARELNTFPVLTRPPSNKRAERRAQ